MERTKVLFVEDDMVLGFMVKDFLQKRDYEVTYCNNGEFAWHQFVENRFDICLLDIVLPGEKDGLYLTGKIRTRNENIPIMLLSSKNSADDIQAGFRQGADDYVTKPYDLRELMLRMQVFLSRTGVAAESVVKKFMVGNMVFDHSNLTLGNQHVHHVLTQLEADLLRLFCDNPGRVFAKDEILLKVWKTDDFTNIRSLHVFIARIRKLIRDQKSVRLLTVHGEGYRFYNDPE